MFYTIQAVNGRVILNTQEIQFVSVPAIWDANKVAEIMIVFKGLEPPAGKTTFIRMTLDEYNKFETILTSFGRPSDVKEP